MKTVVVTGSTRGIGYGLVNSFLDLSCAVVVSGRSSERVEGAVSQLVADHGDVRILGHTCDVTDFEQVQSLWDAAKGRFGCVDIWINNAGLGNAQMDFWDLPAELIESVIGTNVIGAMYGSKVALTGMLEQGHGAIYNMEGLGSSGPRVPGLTLYSTSKAALRYLNESLAKEVEGTGVLVGALRPGMVATDLLMNQYKGRPEEFERAKRIFNILCDRVETVTPWFAQRVLDNDKNGVLISWQTTLKTLSRFLAAPFRKRDVFEGYNLSESSVEE
jgi:NAD(P)-dependent dehydrogenase (short-subunit alcohol dehydrogenase family)